MAAEGSDEDADFRTVLNYALTRNLGGFIQSMRLYVPVPLQCGRVGQSGKKDKGKGKAQPVLELFKEDDNLL